MNGRCTDLFISDFLGLICRGGVLAMDRFPRKEVFCWVKAEKSSSTPAALQR